MPVPRRRHSRQRQAKRRTHDKLHAQTISTCVNCGAVKMRHRVCPTCGQYRGRTYRVVVQS